MSYQAITLADLQTALAARTDANPWWSAEQARLALNEGLRIWNAATAQWTAKLPAVAVPNDPFVPVTSALTQATRVLWNAIPLEKCSLADLDYGIPAWRGALAGQAGHPSRPSYWAPVALNLLVVYPAVVVFPTALEIAGVAATPLLVNAGDFVDLGQEQHDVLLGYALHVLTFSVGGPRLVQTYPGWIRFLQAAAAQNRQFAASAFYRRLLGLDAQRWLRRQERPAVNPVDQVIAQASQSEGG